MKQAKRFLAAALLLPLLIGLAPPSVAEGVTGDAAAAVPDGPASVTGKDEVVYARLSSAGEALNVYVVNHFTVVQGGGFTDHGDYTSVTNLTGLDRLAPSGGAVAVRTASENFYYQGHLAHTNLPWRYQIAYSLDGVTVQPETLAGRSGRLEIRLTSAKNAGIDGSFYDHYMQQITLTLDTEKCRNITADGATAANAGKSRVLAFTVLPGGDASLTVTADVTDFEMAGIDITAMPFSLPVTLPDTAGLLDDFTGLSDAIAALNDGVGRLKDGAAEMTSGAVKLKNGSSDFQGGLAQLGAQSARLTGASAQIRGALTQIASSLSDTGSLSSTPGLSALTKLPGALTQLADGLTQISGGLRQLGDGYAQAYAALDQAIAGIPGHQIGEAQIQGLYAKADENERSLLGALMESYTAAMTVKGVYEQVKAAFAGVGVTLDTLSGSVAAIIKALEELSGQIGGALSGSDTAAQLQQLFGGLSALSENYADFHRGILSYTKGVSELAGGYAGLNAGVTGLSDGLAEMSGGISELSDGAGRLADETSDMPERFQHEIDSLTGRYTDKSFEAVSFTSKKNKNVSFVQFVFQTEDIEKPEVKNDTPAETKPLGFWERLSALFR